MNSLRVTTAMTSNDFTSSCSACINVDHKEENVNAIGDDIPAKFWGPFFSPIIEQFSQSLHKDQHENLINTSLLTKALQDKHFETEFLNVER